MKSYVTALQLSHAESVEIGSKREKHSIDLLEVRQ